MGFFELSKEERQKLVGKISSDIENDLSSGSSSYMEKYFSDEDAFFRKVAYLGLSRIFKNDESRLLDIIKHLNELIDSENHLIRQSVIYAAGEIGISSFEEIKHILIKGFSDTDNQVRYAVIGSLKRIGEKNPIPILKFAEEYITHPDEEVRKEICHGIELRGRIHPEEILPILKKLEFDKSRSVREMLIHVLGQISNKEECLEKVISDLKKWTNKKLIKDALEEIIQVQSQYMEFSSNSKSDVEKHIKREFSDLFL